jgi:DNA-binding MarR family transcriptional regulator/GNAT superfamily N-acetyltransferase
MTAAAAPDTAADVAAIRAFNRFYTARVGALRDGLLATAHPLPEARVLYELGQVESADFADLRRALDLDAGYLSRLLARLEAQGLVARERAAHDGRRQRVALTAKGQDAYRTVDERSRAEIATLLDGLTDDDRRRLLGALGTAQAILASAPAPSSFVLRDPRPGDYGWVVQRHGALYAAEYGFDATFEALVARVVADHANDHDPERERAWIAEAAGRPVGCVFCMRRDERTAQLRCLLVEPSARGLGVGQALVDACVAFARQAGYAEIVLWTNDVLVGARRLYERAGFALVASSPHRSFGREDLVGEDWAFELGGS